MQIDLNDPNQFTLDGVKALIASADDSKNHQLRVTNTGMAFLSNDVGNIATNNLAFRFETWDEGNDYVGLSASQDNEWVSRIYKALKENWPNPKHSYIDEF